jgi:alpha/beta superfamily hydrolase
MHGGTMHTKVVHRAARLLSDRFTLAALRFNFRGVGASAGVYDEGLGETEDLVAAGAWVRARVPSGPFVVGGFSFGSLRAMAAAPRLGADVLFLIGVPTDRWDGVAPASPARSVVWIQGERDPFSPPEKARHFAAARGWNVLVVPGADHFFAGKLDEFQQMAGDALAAALGATT